MSARKAPDPVAAAEATLAAAKAERDRLSGLAAATAAALASLAAERQDALLAGATVPPDVDARLGALERDGAGYRAALAAAGQAITTAAEALADARADVLIAERDAALAELDAAADAALALLLSAGAEVVAQADDARQRANAASSGLADGYPPRRYPVPVMVARLAELVRQAELVDRHPWGARALTRRVA